MIVVDCEQGSPEWVAARLGVPTASAFHRVITPRTAKESAASEGYLAELVAEWLLGEPLDPDVSGFMTRGTELEQTAIRFYECQRDVDVARVGFVLADDSGYGCSPDGLVGEDGGLELKCPGPAAHVRHLLALEYEAQPTEYYAQVQGSMYVTGRAWWDFLSYHPTLPPALVRYARDDVFCGSLAGILGDFCARLAEAKEKMIARGYHPPDGAVSGWLRAALERSVQAQT